MTSKEYLSKLRHLEFLQGLAKEYEGNLKVIQREEKYFHVYGIQYSSRGDIQMMDVNSAYFPAECIKEGLLVGLTEINVEIEELKNELRNVTVTLE